MADKHDKIRYENGMAAVRAHVDDAILGVEDGQKARAQAREALEAYKKQKSDELELAAKRFSFLQRFEFVVGALAIVQVAVWMLILKSELSPLILTIGICLVLYLIVAIMDSRAKGAREDIRYQIQAAKKAKLKTGGDVKGVVVLFE
ncbi:MAG: hypothetical protein LBS98_05630 [Coriobacteriales bacterium]|jgi:hypothetical protein|nr:hypothetical protein [Coriobacteriales bacterium]